MSLTDAELSRFVVGSAGTTGDLLFRMKRSTLQNVNAATAAITVSQVSRDYNVEPDTVIFGRQYTSNAMYTTTPSVSSKNSIANKDQIVSQVYQMKNDFLPLIVGTPRLDVPDIISLGNDITFTWYPDTSSQRKSHPSDWVGLYRKGECRDESAESTLHPPKSLSMAETNHVHRCYLAWAQLEPEQLTGTVSFTYDSYKVAGEYEVRYFYGDSRDGQGFKCGLIPGTTGRSPHCVLRAKATSRTITVVKSGPAESMESIPGMETFTDPDDGNMYVSGF
jgi:hypothetical protein